MMMILLLLTFNDTYWCYYWWGLYLIPLKVILLCYYLYYIQRRNCILFIEEMLYFRWKWPCMTWRWEEYDDTILEVVVIIRWYSMMIFIYLLLMMIWWWRNYCEMTVPITADSYLLVYSSVLYSTTWCSYLIIGWPCSVMIPDTWPCKWCVVSILIIDWRRLINDFDRVDAWRYYSSAMMPMNVWPQRPTLNVHLPSIYMLVKH